MRNMVEGVGRPHRLCPNAPSVGFAATSPREVRGRMRTT